LSIRIRRLRRRTTFLVARWLVRLAGFDRCRPLGRVLGTLQYHLLVSRRRRALADLAVVLRRHPDDPVLSSTLRSAYRVNSIGVLEVASMVDRKLDAARILQRCRVEGIENLSAARAGRGVILLATHSCNSLLVLAQLAGQGWPLTIVYRRSPSMPPDFDLMGLRNYGFEGVAAEDGLKSYVGMVEALRRDRVLFAMMDHGVTSAESGVPMRFLGKDMPMPGGIVQLARQTRAPIVPLTALAIDPVWHFRIEPALRIDPGGSFEEDAAAVMKHVEGQILSHPELWSWPHRRWRKYPLAAETSGGSERSAPRDV
jgi:lauroyl/myristoyl acyltransferase